MGMEEVLQHLKNLGFTELEAKCLHVLAEAGTQTGYEIAKRLGVSRSNVYSALQKLAENDQNLYIRSQARNMLAQTAEID